MSRLCHYVDFHCCLLVSLRQLVLSLQPHPGFLCIRGQIEAFTQIGKTYFLIEVTSKFSYLLCICWTIYGSLKEGGEPVMLLERSCSEPYSAHLDNEEHIDLIFSPVFGLHHCWHFPFHLYSFLWSADTSQYNWNPPHILHSFFLLGHVILFLSLREDYQIYIC